MTAPKKKVKRKVFRFTKDSAIVKSWVGVVLSGAYKLEEVPDVLNLYEMVVECLAELGYKEVEEEAPAAPAPAEPSAPVAETPAPTAPEATPAPAAETPAPAEPAPAEPVHYIDPVA